MPHDTTPELSVVTACRNADAYLEQCIVSVATQDFGRYEHIVIDGGSTDRTREILQRNARHLGYWHSEPDRGIGHAFNLGLARSRGKWLLFLNADDYLCRPDALRVLCARAGTADVIYGKVQPVSRSADPRPAGKPLGWRYAPWEFLFRDLIPHPAALTSRAFFDRVGPFREDLKIAVDYEHYLREYRSLKTAFVPEVVAHMRVGGLSQDKRASIEEMLRAQALNCVMPAPLHVLFRGLVRSKAAAGRIVRWTLGA